MTIDQAIQYLESDDHIDPLVKGFALDALHKQKPVHPINHINLGCVCKSCGWIVERQDHYCPGCGSRIDWDVVMKHGLRLLDDHTIILTIPKGTRVDRVLVEEMGMKTGTMYLPEQATFRNLKDLHCVYDMGLITLEQYLNERNRLEGKHD